MLFIAEQLGNAGPGKGSGSCSCAAALFYQECVLLDQKGLCVFCFGAFALMQPVLIISVFDV